jgi:hypothetical protein
MGRGSSVDGSEARKRTAVICYSFGVDDAAGRAARRRAQWKAGVAHSFEEMDEVDLDFWLAVTPANRVRAMWSMVEDTLALRGHHGPAPRLQRSVGGVRPLRS